MHKGIRSRWHRAVFTELADRPESRFFHSLAVTSPGGEVQLRASVIDVTHREPGHGRNVRVPSPIGLVIVAIVAGVGKNRRHFRGRGGSIFQCLRLIEGRICSSWISKLETDEH